MTQRSSQRRRRILGQQHRWRTRSENKEMQDEGSNESKAQTARTGARRIHALAPEISFNFAL